MTNLRWPAMTDYVTAIAHPQQFMSDPDLREAHVALRPLGMPMNWCGANAVVFQCSSNARVWAVRCFTKTLRDQQERYAAASATIPSSLRTSILVDFVYLSKGILVQGEWYPVVKMDWVEGETLDEAISTLISAKDTQAIHRLSETWIEVMRKLRVHKIAHGDLQHANILVRANQIKLVDYDGMYVPSLHGRQSLELGLPHYQHPARTGNDLGVFQMS